jgi:predicted ArsR family transcriptional regulator
MMFELRGPVTARQLRDVLGINGTRIRHILYSLVRDGLVSEGTYQRGYRTEIGYTVDESVQSTVEAGVQRASSADQPSDQNLSTGTGSDSFTRELTR